MTLHVEQLQGRRQDRGLGHTLVTQRTLSSGPVWWAVGPSWQTAATRRCSAAELISFPHIHLHVFILRELRPAGGGGPSPVLLQSQRVWEEEEERKGRCRPCLPSMQTQPAETVTPPPPRAREELFQSKKRSVGAPVTLVWTPVHLLQVTGVKQWRPTHQNPLRHTASYV